jgi:uncharacterized SAM-binding protein YcdF (DUF218 family)
MDQLNEMLSTLRMLWRTWWPWVRRWARRTISATGVLALLMILLAGTRIPFDAHRWLGTALGQCKGGVDAIVVLGGSGMPSGPELLRLHRAATLATEFPSVPVVVIHPDTADAMRQMVQELVLRGVEQGRITRLTEGENTREQALVFVRSFPGKDGHVALVTAPENIYRSVLAFRKAGVGGACGVPAWEHAMFHDFDYAHEAIGGKAWTPDISQKTGLRYTFWNYLKLEITCLREYAAIAYYKLNGWI